jgi:hypothetical protein
VIVVLLGLVDFLKVSPSHRQRHVWTWNKFRRRFSQPLQRISMRTGIDFSRYLCRRNSLGSHVVGVIVHQRRTKRGERTVLNY